MHDLPQHARARLVMRCISDDDRHRGWNQSQSRDLLHVANVTIDRVERTPSPRHHKSQRNAIYDSKKKECTPKTRKMRPPTKLTVFSEILAASMRPPTTANPVHMV